MYITKDEVAGACLAFPATGDTEPMQVRGYAQKVLGHRAYERFKQISDRIELMVHGIDRVILAGGAMLHAPARDLDLWCGPGDSLAKLASATTTNSRVGEYQWGGISVQVCVVEDYGPHLSLVDLLPRFDFAHCQVGATLQFMNSKKDPIPKWIVTEVLWTPAYEAAMLVQGTSYNTAGHQAVWRDNSLARLPEVARKFGLTRGECRAIVQQILGCIAAEPKTATASDPFGTRAKVDIPF